jgi:hypothetical protein
MEKNVNRKYILALIVFFGISLLPAAESGIDFSIRYFDKRVYYLEQDPILIQVTVTNNGPTPFRFKLADERAFSVDFDVRTNSNRLVDAADILIRKRSQSQQVYFREVSVEAGESFSFVEDLKNYAALTQSGAYVVQARIYPELYQTVKPEPAGVWSGGISPGATLAANGKSLESNRLTLTIRPRLIPGPDGIPLELDVETNAVLVREKLPPDEVISYLLTARQKSQWEKFFLYLDLEAILSRDAYRRRQYNAESEEGRQRMTARYRQDLQNSVIDGDISLIPMNFTIERTVYNGQTGTVTVLEYFRVGNYTERKRYTWYLEKRDDIWTIVDYSVVNLGTE